MIVIDVGILTIVVGSLLPILVGIVTKKVESSGLKASLLLFLSALSGLAATAINGGGIISSQTLVAAVVAYVVAVASHFGFYSPSGITDKVQENLGRTSEK